MIRRCLAFILLLFALWVTLPANAAEIVFDQAEINYDQSETIPTLGWRHVQLPLRVAKLVRLADGTAPKVIWLRLVFDHSKIKPGDVVMAIAQSGGKTEAYLNSTPFLASLQTFSAAIPETLLQSGENDLTLRITLDDTATTAAAGVRIGTAGEINATLQWQYFIQYLGPILASTILALIGAVVLFIWFIRRTETALLWLAALALVAGVSGLQLVFNRQPIALPLLFLAILGNATTFYRSSARSLQVRGVVALATCIALLCAIHDAVVNLGLWLGLGLLLSPYGSLLLVSVLAAVSAQKFAEKLKAGESQNEQLSLRIETTKANLIVSETARRTLEVSNAIASERARMMREIHDGIGSSLMAALASAERQGRTSTTAVVALKSALTDLRIAVDSLEPAEGNVTTLLASLRYRLEPELLKSGIAFEWQVDEGPGGDWLDAQNALHILRIFQEALGNVLGHANATRITVVCKLGMNEGRPGIIIQVKDNGGGFDTAIPPQGRGRKNMMQRAESLAGKLSVESEPGHGTVTTLWLPLMRGQ